MMKCSKGEPQPKDNLGAFPQEAQDKYKFFLKLFELVRRSEKVNSNDPAIVRQVYLSHKVELAYPNDERTAQQMIADFFKPEEYLKRLNIHREQICKSKTKKQQHPCLYIVELCAKDRQLNLIDYIPADKANGLDARQVIEKDIQDKRKAAEAKEERRQKAIEAKKKQAQVDKDEEESK